MYFERGKWLFDFQEDYSQFFQGCNWYTFQFAHIEFENDSILGAYEGTVKLLGLGIRIRWNHTETDELRSIHESVADIEAQIDGAKV